MAIIERYPPNIAEIRQYLDVEAYQPIFCFGDDIYNPYKVVIPEDILFHESVHAKQQAHYPSPDIWWTKYLLDSKFRKEVETEAYARQYLWLKQFIPAKGYKEALEEFAEILASPLYNLNINKYQARTLLTIKSKEEES